MQSRVDERRVVVSSHVPVFDGQTGGDEAVSRSVPQGAGPHDDPVEISADQVVAQEVQTFSRPDAPERDGPGGSALNSE